MCYFLNNAVKIRTPQSQDTAAKSLPYVTGLPVKCQLSS